MAPRYKDLEDALEDEEESVERHGSRGEKQIARMFKRYGVRFFYETPVAVVDRGKVRLWYPDFWLPDFGVAVEYAGVIGDADYDAGVEHKKAVYEASGIPCVYVHADALRGCWPKRIMEDIRAVLRERMGRLESLAGEFPEIK